MYLCSQIKKGDKVMVVTDDSRFKTSTSSPSEHNIEPWLDVNKIIAHGNVYTVYDNDPEAFSIEVSSLGWISYEKVVFIVKDQPPKSSVQTFSEFKKATDYTLDNEKKLRAKAKELGYISFVVPM